MKEVWKDIYFEENNIIYDYRGLYQISNLGRIKSLTRISMQNHVIKERILKYRIVINNYCQVSLYKDNKCKQFYVHRLVAHMFIPNPYNLSEVNHKNENQLNNCAYNLEWCHREYNNNYGTRNKRISSKMKYRKNNLKKLIARYNISWELIDIKYQFEYTEMGFSKQGIYQCCYGNQKTVKLGTEKFIFKYIDDVLDEEVKKYIIKYKQIKIGE